MSDLGKLFFYRETAHQRPIENFTTTALAIAINHDDRPIRIALGSLRPPDQSPPTIAVPFEWPAALARFDARQVASSPRITAKTQVTKWEAGPVPRGYLDLVLEQTGTHQRTAPIWVEVKVDAWESGDQLWVYARHAEKEPGPTPVLVTLGRVRIVPHIASLTWSAVADAVSTVPDAHHSWHMLRDFLLEEHIARPPLSSDSPEVQRATEVIVAINERIRQHWPQAEKDLTWYEGSLRRSLRGWQEIDGRMVTSAGPLRYGLVPANESWDWTVQFWLQNYQRVPLGSEAVLRQADSGSLPDDWSRDPMARAILDRRLPLGRYTDDRDVLSWFDDSLGHLDSSGVMGLWLKGRARDLAAAAADRMPSGRGATTDADATYESVPSID
jgi:hypothetical protein